MTDLTCPGGDRTVGAGAGFLTLSNGADRNAREAVLNCCVAQTRGRKCIGAGLASLLEEVIVCALRKQAPLNCLLNRLFGDRRRVSHEPYLGRNVCCRFSKA